MWNKILLHNATKLKEKLFLVKTVELSKHTLYHEAVCKI